MKRVLWGVLALLLVGAFSLVYFLPKGEAPQDGDSNLAQSDLIDEPEDDFDMVAAKHPVASFCGDCHAVPTPDQFPQSAWPEEIDDGYRFYFDSGRRDLKMPPKRIVLEYYRRLAPKELLVKPGIKLAANPKVRFVSADHAYTEIHKEVSLSTPAVANVR